MLGTIHVCKYLKRNALIRAYYENESLEHHIFTNKFFISLSYSCEQFEMGFTIFIIGLLKVLYFNHSLSSKLTVQKSFLYEIKVKMI